MSHDSHRDVAGLALDPPAVMGIVNVTPDSFYDGGQLYTPSGRDLSSIMRRVEAMVDGGASLLDVGGESTRPGAQPVSLQQEIDRVVPVVEAISARFAIPISVDTSKAGVISAAAGAGAALVNDVRALRSPGALQATVAVGLPVCLMHMRGEPGTMQNSPEYSDVVQDVLRFLMGRVEACVAAGIPENHILLDPGFGFGKSLRHNLLLMKGLPALVGTGFPVLVGVSRKSMIGALTGRPVTQRLPGSLALAALAVIQGAAVIRVHDVAETRDVVTTINAVIKEE